MHAFLSSIYLEWKGWMNPKKAYVWPWYLPTVVQSICHFWLSTSLPTPGYLLGLFFCSTFVILIDVVYLSMVLTCISLMTNEAEHYFLCFLAIGYSLSWNIFPSLLYIFPVGCLLFPINLQKLFIYSRCKSFVRRRFWNIVFHVVYCLFPFLMVSSDEVLSLNGLIYQHIFLYD